MQRQPIIWYLLLYALFLAAMHFGYGFGVTEPVLVLLLFGLGLSLLALWTTRHAKPRNITVKHARQESAILGGYLVIVVSFITWGLPGVRLISAQPMLQAALVTIAKLLVMVIVPFAIWRAAVCVAAGWRNKGIGSLLLRFAEETIFSEAPNVFMCVSSFNKQAQRLYERLGYQMIGELEDYIVSGHSEILLRKTIAPLTEFKKKKA